MMSGSEIPEWFSRQKSDSSIKIPLPINLPKDSQWIGVACCCIFFNNDASRKETIRCYGSLFRGENRRPVCWRARGARRRFSRSIMKDHLFLRYFPRDQLSPFSSEDYCGYNEGIYFLTADYFDQICHEFEVSFIRSSVKVKKCDIRVVYEKDLEEIKELQCHTTQSSPNFEHIHQPSPHNDESKGSTSHIKRKLDIYEETEEEEPQPKRMQKIFNFILGQSTKKH
ncbi:hypothetical protein ES332_A11G361800v1 [Gossypium tomentosum]|uniref:C-JID domain-containing protein n=1 Tax=Gossypium tomentosum TaxID=34277 RepID=A0A5D2NJ97_GOSTO|nr:hypothetical protein ES332_A11G361800v1 [Gossypium tomentosum]